MSLLITVMFLLFCGLLNFEYCFFKNCVHRLILLNFQNSNHLPPKEYLSYSIHSLPLRLEPHRYSPRMRISSKPTGIQGDQSLILIFHDLLTGQITWYKLFSNRKNYSIQVTLTNFASEHSPSQVSESLLVSRFNPLHWTMFLTVPACLVPKSGFVKTRVKVGSLQNIQRLFFKKGMIISSNYFGHDCACLFT